MQLLIILAAATAAIFTFCVWAAKWADSALSQKTKDSCRQLLLSEPFEAANPARFVQEFHKHVVEALLGTRLTSRRFVIRSIMLSAIFLTFFATIVASKSGAASLNLGMFQDSTALSIFGFLLALAVTIFIDYISFAQTVFFISLVKETQSIFQIFLIGLADVVLTSNIFTFLFPICLVALALMYDATSGPLTMKARLIYQEDGKERAYSVPIYTTPSRLFYRGHV